ncbi:MAG: signal peptidase [Planctomycetes bacterium]|nr:signal peptidase [Planctomycetota bacterium]
MRFLGDFENDRSLPIKRLDQVIIKTERGLENGEVLCPATPQAVAYLAEPTNGHIVRLMTDEDRQRVEHLRSIHKKEYLAACAMVADHKLAMQIIDVEHLFGGERLVFFFLSEKRIDFRELVKSMAREFQTRIELRQVGIRDEAKLLADYGDCGKPVCCNTHMAVMPPVSMRMAKLQKATLDPTKISGRCGRLKCCLRFEQDVYDEFHKDLPPVGSRILTNKGQGKVLAQEILARKLLVEFEDGRRLPVAADDVLTRL